MKSVVSLGIAAALATAATAVASPVLHIDVNNITTQARNSSNVNVPFGGTTHTGSILFGFQSGASPSVIAGLDSEPFIGGAATNLGFTGTMSNFSGEIDLTNGGITGGNIRVDLSNGDFYQTSITPGSGSVQTFVGGGFTVQGLTFNGNFQDSVFGNVNIAQWFVANINGAFLQFNFNPNANGASNADVDVYIQAVPLPSAAIAGFSTLAGMGLMGYVRNRRR